ncbi:MAG: anthranilate synthase component II [Pasteurellaceae bacterium]|nr:anthranilate synthase component II [Pasteurellaceae bacterium]
MSAKLLIINNYDSFTYNLVDLVRQLDCDFDVVNVDQFSLEQVQDYSHLLISPGPDTPDSYPQLFDMLRKFYQEKAILGVCLGHQALCQFFGAKLYNLPTVRHGQQGWLRPRSKNPLFLGLPEISRVGLYHSWAVSEQQFPTELWVTARDDEGIIMAIAHKTLPIFGVQFHPESYMSEQGKQILINFLNCKPKK